jgi:chemotaxis protein CheD
VQVKRLAFAPDEPVARRERQYLRRLDGKRSGEIEIFRPRR